MKSMICRLAIAALLCVPFVTRGQVLLSLDINDRTDTLGGTPFPGFMTFQIDGVGSATAIQTAPSVRIFGDYTVTLSGVGATTGYDDRQRATPVNGGTFSQELLLRDFVFSRDLGTGGLDVTIEGLDPDTAYKVTLWSFDSGSGGTRVSDWFANGTLVRGDYTFDGRVAPTTDAQYKFSFPVTANGTGQVFIQGRRKNSVDAAGAQSFGVFLNALQVEIGPPDPPTIVLQPQSQSLFAGDNAIFSSQSAGASPITVQWYLGPTPGENPIEDATNTTLVLFNTSAGNAGSYSMIATSPFGSATSQVATLTVTPVANLTSGLVGHWPLDTLDASTPDVTPNMNDLFQLNMDFINVEEGRYVSALRFNGTDEYVARTNNGTTGLPLYGSPGYTVAMWVKGTGTGQNDRRVWSESADTNNTPLMTIGTHSGGTDGSVDIFIRGNSGGNPINHRRTSLMAFDGSWHHIAWVDNNGFGRVYVDGVADTADFNYVRVPLQGNILSLGAVVRTNVVAQYNGLIDDVHAWRRSLSEDEVRLVMNQIQILSLAITGGNVVLSFTTANVTGMHRVDERSEFPSGPWSEVMGVNFGAPSGNVITATFPVPMGGQRFYRVAF